MKFPPPYPDPFPAQRKVILPLRWIIIGFTLCGIAFFGAEYAAFIVIGVVAKVRGWM